MKKRLVFLSLVLLIAVGVARSERVKDITEIQGVRGNALSGVGLVIGLAGTGDSTLPSQQMLTNILRDRGLVVSPSDMSGGNIAIVMVTAELGPFDREGSKIDVDVSSIGDAESLQGGILLSTLLIGLDEQVYAEAHGGIFIGGWSAGGDNASISKNHPAVGRIPSGAVVEKSEIATFVEYIEDRMYITLNLRNKDFTTVQRITDAINGIYQKSSVAIDAGTVRMRVPDGIDFTGVAGFINEVGKLEVKVDMPAVVVINERTGTIVVGKNVGISEVAISQGSLVIKIKEQQLVSQPTAPFSEGATTEVVDETLIDVEEKDGYLVPIARVVTVSELARSLNAIGATPRDLIAIFNALKKAGALQARLEIM